MIDCVFTLDYEIYGNGTGALTDLVYEPARRLRGVFQAHHARFVVFVEAAELERIETCGTDRAIDLVKRQVRQFYDEGFEIALHLHPQWCNARYDRRRWFLDYSEYNLCTLPRARIREIVSRSIEYLRHLLANPDFTPLAFRAGNWLFQPTEAAADVLAGSGMRIDSSVFKGGLQREHKLDYRRALRNGYYWSFGRDVNESEADGAWIEIPVYTEMVPFWRMLTSKRIGLQTRGGSAGPQERRRRRSILDFLRFRYPLKLDFCRMTLNELTSVMGRIIQEDRNEPALYRPVVAIGHTKDLVDLHTVESFLAFLHTHAISVSTFADIYPTLRKEIDRGAPESRRSQES